MSSVCVQRLFKHLRLIDSLKPHYWLKLASDSMMMEYHHAVMLPEENEIRTYKKYKKICLLPFLATYIAQWVTALRDANGLKLQLFISG